LLGAKAKDDSNFAADNRPRHVATADDLDIFMVAGVVIIIVIVVVNIVIV